MQQIDRLFEYFLKKGVKHPAKIERFLNSANGSLKKIRNSDGFLSDAMLIKVEKACPDLNMQWLKTGEGEMLKPLEPLPGTIAREDAEPYGVTWKQKYYNLMEEHAKLLRDYNNLLKEMAGVKKAV